MAVLAHLFGLVSSQYLPDFHTWRELRLKVLCFRADGYMAFSKFTGRYSFTAKPKFCCSTSTETRHGRLGSDGLCLGRWHLISSSDFVLMIPKLCFVQEPRFSFFSSCVQGFFRLPRGSSSVENSVFIEDFCIRRSAIWISCRPND